MRVVSLNCSNTEIVAALGCGAMLVGVDSDSDWPTELVAPLPRVGRDLDIDVEAVKALRPDLVLASRTVPGHDAVVERLERAGLRHLAPRTRSLAGVCDDIRTIADCLGVAARGAEVAERLAHGVAQAGTPDASGPRILVQWWPKPVIAPGRQSWVHDLLAAVGARNPLGERDVESEPLADERVAELDPDAIVISWCGVATAKYRPDVVYARAAWQDCAFVRRRRVFCIPEALLGRPAPRLLQGAVALREIVEALRG